MPRLILKVDSLIKINLSLVVLLLLIPFMLSPYQFIDGLTYSALAHNLAIGEGSWLSPFYSNSLYHNFYEHPPLSFWMQSFFFWLLGDHFLVDKVYGLLSALLLLWLIRKSFKKMVPLFYKGFNWLPIVLLCTAPIFFFALRGNLLEIPLSLFTFSAGMLLVFWFRKRTWYYLPLAGILVFMAVLTKGPVGLFPLAIPVLYTIVFQEKWLKSLLPTLVPTVLSCGIIYLLYILNEDFKSYADVYFERQFLASLAGEREVTVGSRFSILIRLLQELVVPILLAVRSARIAKKAGFHFEKEAQRLAVLCIAIGLSATLPFLVSTKQRAFYLTPGLIWYAMGLSIFIVPWLKVAMGRIETQLEKWLKPTIWLLVLMLVGFSAYRFNRFPGGKEKLGALYTQLVELPKEPMPIMLAQELSKDWGVYGYITRFTNLSSTVREERAHYIIGNPKTAIPEGMREVSSSDYFVIFERIQ